MPSVYGNYASIIFLSFVILGLCVVGFFLLSAIRKRLRGPDLSPGVDTGFTLAELRRLARRGQLTPEEFERAREKLIDSARRQTPVGNSPQSGLLIEPKIDQEPREEGPPGPPQGSSGPAR